MHVSKIAAMVGLLGLFTVGCGGMTKEQKALMGNLGNTAGALAKGDTKGAAKQIQKTDVNKSV